MPLIKISGHGVSIYYVISGRGGSSNHRQTYPSTTDDDQNLSQLMKIQFTFDNNEMPGIIMSPASVSGQMLLLKKNKGNTFKRADDMPTALVC